MWLYLLVAGSGLRLFNMEMVKDVQESIVTTSRSCLTYPDGEEVYVEHSISQLCSWLKAGGAHLGTAKPGRHREPFEEDN